MNKDLVLELSTKLDEYKKELSNLFQSEHLTDAFQRNLHYLNNYYMLSFWQAESLKKKQVLVAEFALLIETIKKIQSGSLTAESALTAIDNSTKNERAKIVLHNIFKTCELLFWLTTTLTSYAFCIGFGVPLMFFNLPVGLAFTLGTCVITLAAAEQAFNCIGDFKSTNTINYKERLERRIFSFFLTPKDKAPELDNEPKLHNAPELDKEPEFDPSFECC